MIFFLYREDDWIDDLFKKKYGSVLDEIDVEPHPKLKGYNKKWALFFPVMIIFRRLAFVGSVVLIPDQSFFQITIQMLLTMINMSYLLHFKPHCSFYSTIVEIFNEVINLILMYHILCFTFFVPEAKIRYLIGYSFIGFTVFNLGVHIILMLVEVFQSLAATFKARITKNSKKNPIENLDKEQECKPIEGKVDEGESSESIAYQHSE